MRRKGEGQRTGKRQKERKTETVTFYIIDVKNTINACIELGERLCYFKRENQDLLRASYRPTTLCP